MIQIVLTLAAFGFAGGYLAGHAALWEDFQARWQSNKDASYGAYIDLQGNVSDRTLRQTVRMYRNLTAGKFWEAITCPTCAGWHATWIGLLIWTQAGTLDIDPADAFIVWIAAAGVHTLAMRLYERGL